MSVHKWLCLWADQSNISHSLYRITWWLTHLECGNRLDTSALWKMMTWLSFLIWKVRMMSGRVPEDMTGITPMGALTAFGWKSISWYMGKNAACRAVGRLCWLTPDAVAFQIGGCVQEATLETLPLRELLFSTFGMMAIQGARIISLNLNLSQNICVVAFPVLLVGDVGEIFCLMDALSDAWLKGMWRQYAVPSLYTVFCTTVGMRTSKASSGTWLALLKMARQKNCRTIQVITNSYPFVFLQGI